MPTNMIIYLPLYQIILVFPNTQHNHPIESKPNINNNSSEQTLFSNSFFFAARPNIIGISTLLAPVVCSAPTLLRQISPAFVVVVAAIGVVGKKLSYMFGYTIDLPMHTQIV